MSDKPKFPHDQARAVAEEIYNALRPSCVQIVIAGSLRRLVEQVGDIEILYVPRRGKAFAPGEMFEREIDLAEREIRTLIATRVLELRPNVNGTTAFGPQNKLLRHRASGIPVDLFATDQACWFNYLVCRTGPASFNIRVAQRAKELGWGWQPYDSGFSRERPGDRSVVEWRVIKSEEDLFEFLGWEFLQPWERARNLVVAVQKNGGRGVSPPAAQSNLMNPAGDDGLDRRLEENGTPKAERLSPT